MLGMQCHIILAFTLILTSGLNSESNLDFNSMSLEDFLKIEVSFASKTKETIFDAPSSVTVFTRDEITNLGIKYLEDLLQFIPGFQSQLQISGGSSTTIQVRGKPENGYLSKDVLVLLDGLRLNDAYSGGSSMLNRFTTLENVERIEVIRGPGSALYGSNAFLGVINIVTIHKNKQATVRFGSFSEAAMSAHLNAELGDWSFSCFLRSYRDEGDTHYIPVDFIGNSGEAKDPQKTTNMHTKIQFKNFQFVFSKLNQNLPDYMGGIAIGGEGINMNIQNQELYSASYNYQVNENFMATISASRVSGDEYMLWNWTPIEFIFGAYLKVYNDSFNLDFNYSASKNNSINFGVSHELRGIKDNAIIRNQGTKIVYFRNDGGITRNRNQKVSALYFQDQHRFSDALKLIFGLRYDRYSDTGDTTSPRAALIAATPWRGKLKFLYGQAFLAPTNSEQYQMNTSASNGNPDLIPEIIKTTEIAYVQNLSKITTTFTYYNNKITNKIELVPDADSSGNTIPGNTIPVNQGEIHMNGLEVEFQSSISKSLFIRGAYSKQFDDIDIWSSGETFALILNQSNRTWGFNLNGYYQSGVEKVANVQGGTAILNTSIKLVLKKKLELRLNLANLLNRTIWYPDAPFTDHPGEIQPNRGSSFEFLATYHY